MASVKLSRHHCGLMARVMAMPAQPGEGVWKIKDLRLLNMLIKQFDDHKPEDKRPPQIVAADPTKPTAEEQQSHQAAMAAWEKEMETYVSEPIEVELGDLMYGMAKNKVQSFNWNPALRVEACAIADAFDIKD